MASMNLYASIMTFVDAQSQVFITDVTKLIAGALQPMAVTAMGIYILVYGLAHVRGTIQEPIMEFVMRILKMVAVFGIGIGLWNYDAYIVDTFVRSPDALASSISGTSDSIAAMDQILEDSFQIGNKFWKSAGMFNGNIGAFIAAFAVWIAGISVTGYGAFLIILSKIFLAAIIALGPLFIIGLLFEATSKYFEAWIAQLSNYALMPLMVTAVNVFVIGMFKSVSAQAAAKGGSLDMADIFPVLVTALVSMLVLAQVPSATASLAGGLAISTMGVGRAVFGKAASTATAPIRAAGRGMKNYAGRKAGEAAKSVGRRVANRYRASRNKIERAA